MVEEKTVSRHQVILKHRESLVVDGVINVDSFDESEVVIETDDGMLIIRGEDMHVKDLNLDKAHLSLEGFVRVMEYTGDGARKGRGWLGRILR